MVNDREPSAVQEQDLPTHDSGIEQTGRLTPKSDGGSNESLPQDDASPQGDGDPGDERADSEDDGAGDPMRDERVGE